MRVYVAADLHVRLTGPRADECQRCIDWLVSDVAEVDPDVVVLAGDLYDRRATPAEERYVVASLQNLAHRDGKEIGRPVYVVRGNHDDPDQIAILSEVDAGHGMIAGVYAPCRLDDTNLVLLPWPSVGHLAAAMPGASIQERREAAHTALVDVLRGLRSDDQAGAPPLLVGHANVVGAAQDSGQPVTGGEEISLSVADLLECHPGAVALGHIHVRQQLRADVPVWYCGSLYRNTFGESTGPKGAMVFEWTGSEWRVEERNGPARRMVLVALDRDNPTAIPGPLSDLSGAEVRLRVEFPSDEREAARARADAAKRMLVDAGAFSVVVEERPIVVSRTRCAEITTARGTAEKLAAWSQSAGLEMPTGAGVKLPVLESEVQS